MPIFLSSYKAISAQMQGQYFTRANSTVPDLINQLLPGLTNSILPGSLNSSPASLRQSNTINKIDHYSGQVGLIVASSQSCPEIEVDSRFTSEPLRPHPSFQAKEFFPHKGSSSINNPLTLSDTEGTAQRWVPDIECLARIGVSETEGLLQMEVHDMINKLGMKQHLDWAIKWLDEEACEKASAAAIIFQVNLASIWMCQYRKGYQQRNSYSTYNQDGGNNIILMEAQELVVFPFHLDELQVGLAATPSIIYAVLCHIHQQEKSNSRSLVWSWQWLSHLFLERTKLTEAWSLTILSFTVDSSELFYLINIFYLECLVRSQP